MAMLRRALQIEPNHIKGLELLAEEHRLNGECEESIKILHRAVDVSAIHTGVLRSLGLT